MWSKILCVLVIASAAFAKTDVLLDSMYGLEGRNRMAVCVRSSAGWRHCDAALYSRDWLLARAHCVGAREPHALAVARVALGGSCATLPADGNLNADPSLRYVHELVLHPWFDLALLIVRTPYSDLDEHANATKITNRLRPHGVYRWMKHYMNAPCFSRNPALHHKRLASHPTVLLHPFWYFSVTMLLPSVLYMMFFIYITFYTGNPCSTDKKNSYAKLHYSKKVTHI